jgi:hypothetical protein
MNNTNNNNSGVGWAIELASEVGRASTSSAEIAGQHAFLFVRKVSATAYSPTNTH